MFSHEKKQGEILLIKNLRNEIKKLLADIKLVCTVFFVYQYSLLTKFTTIKN